MRKFRINNDVPVIWRIVDKQTLMPFDLEDKTVKVALQNRFGIVPIEEFDVSGNVISFIFKAAQQGWLGVYTATVSIVDSEGQTWTADDCQMLELVARSCCVDVCDCQGVNATSCVEFAQFIIVDQDLEEGSRNPVAGGPVAEAINGLKRRVFKYHIDEASETLAVIETGEDWIHNCAVLDWLFRNGVEGVDRAEAKVPCVVIGPAGDSGFAQNILGSITANWGEEDGLVYFNALFSSQITQVLVLLNAYYSRAEGSTTWNKNQLEVSTLDLQTVEDNPVERGSGAYSLQQKAEPNNENNASGLCSIAFGHSNEATEHCSYAEGYDNASGGWASHVEGVGNTATPDAHFAHVGGTGCVAGSECSFVHGRGLKDADEQAAFGKYNAFSPSEAFVVGWGESDENRRNAFSVPKSETGSAKVWGESIVTETKSVSYADLVMMRNSHRLVPGRFYRITDYVTATAQEKTSSAGHPFDVIVLALDKNVLSEEAWAIDHSGDTYFKDAGANLIAWKIWYCLDNDKERFAWAAPSDGLYPQISLTAYGETTTLFREPANDREIDGTMYYAYRQNGGPNQIVYFRTEVPSTGDVVYNSSGQDINDASVTVEMISGMQGTGVIYRMIDEWDNDLPYDFKNIKYQLDEPIVSVVVAAYGTTFPGALTRNTSIDTSTGEGAYYGWNYKITAGPGASGTVYTKTLELSEDTVFYSTQSFSSTDVVKVTSVIDEVYTFGRTADNSIAGESHHNRVLPYKSNGPLLLNRITFGDNCYSNSIGNSCSSNSIGDYCSSNSIGYHSSSNSIGDYCENIEFVVDIEGVSGEGSYFSYNTFDPGVKYIKVVRTTVPEPVAIVSGLKLTSGVAGESSSNPYTISTSASYNGYNGNVFPQITFAVNSNGEIVSYNTADLAALIN